MSTGENSRANWRPTRTSTLVVTAVTLATAAALLWVVPEMWPPVLVGIVGAGCLTASLLLLRTVSDGPAATAIAGLLVVPAAVGLLGGAAAAALLVTSRVFPVPSTQFVSTGMLRVTANVGVFLGCVVAVLGLALGARNVLDLETLDRFVGVGLLTGAPPTVATALYVVRGSVSGGEGAVPDLQVSLLRSFALAPDGPGLHLAEFLLVLAAAVGLLAAALRVLPIAELLADTGGGEATDPRVTRLFYLLVGLAAVVGFVGVVFVPLELVLSTDGLRSLLGAGAFGVVRAVSTAGVLRLLLVGVGGLSALAIAGGLAARGLARDDTGWTGGNRAVQARAGPVVAGLLVAFVAIAVAGSVFDRIVDATAQQLPEPVAVELRTRAAEAATVYGEATFTLFLATVLIATIVGLGLAFRLALATGYLTPETAGYSLASAGLFVGVVFAATIDTPLVLVVGGITASLLVWDAGRFGTVLGREVGRGPDTRSTELTHAGGTVLVGLVGALLAAVAATQLRGGLGSGDPVTVVALVALVVGVTSFAAALR